MDKKLELIAKWLKMQNWQPLSFQEEAWDLILQGASGLISVPTGAGKTYAAYLGALAKMHSSSKKGIQILYITPLKALARDLEYSLLKPIQDLQLNFKVEKRTGDTSTKQRLKQNINPPEILLTTPESLSLLLTYSNADEQFKNLQMIIVDEWHELMGSKRGVLLELSISRLKHYSSDLMIWGLTATIGNLQQAAKVCVGNDRIPSLITASIPREVILETLLPSSFEELPWAGQLGMKMLPYLIQKLSPESSTLIFTNTRGQAEKWYQAIAEAKPSWKSILALHHSAIDKKERELVEEQLKQGSLKFVVCTSSLDLGVDFSPVEQVFQVGSPKSIARLLQRAGRSSHRPLTPCRLCIIPTHALELLELNAYRKALKEHHIENRFPLTNCYDVLIQHLITCAIGGGFKKKEILQQLQSTHAFQSLKEEELDCVINFLIEGGNALGAYPEYKKLHYEDDVYKVSDKKIIQLHRMNIGTITSDPHVFIKTSKGKTLGMIEENFISSLSSGDQFLFGGKLLELIQFRDLVAYVRLGKKKSKIAAVWKGGRLPFSESVSKLLRVSMEEKEENFPEHVFIASILSQQNNISHVPRPNELLMEILNSREGWHLFIYPFEGKGVHQGLAYLIASRLSKKASTTFKISTNDYGIELLSQDPFETSLLTSDLFSSENLEEEISSIINLHELKRSFFRDIARISGLIFQGYPGRHKSQRQIQVSSSLLYEVFSKYDPENLLLVEAHQETMYQHFDLQRLNEMLYRLQNSALIKIHLKKISPFALPLFIERMSGHLSTESILERVEKIKKSWSRS